MLVVLFFWSHWRLDLLTSTWPCLLWYWIILPAVASCCSNLVFWQNMRYCNITACDWNLVFFTERLPPFQPLKQGNFPALYRKRRGVETLLGKQEKNETVSTTQPSLYSNTDEACNAMQVTVMIYVTYMAPAITAMLTYALFFAWSTFLLFPDTSPGPGRMRACSRIKWLSPRQTAAKWVYVGNCRCTNMKKLKLAKTRAKQKQWWHFWPKHRYLFLDSGIWWDAWLNAGQTMKQESSIKDEVNSREARFHQYRPECESTNQVNPTCKQINELQGEDVVGDQVIVAGHGWRPLALSLDRGEEDKTRKRDEDGKGDTGEGEEHQWAGTGSGAVGKVRFWEAAE